MMKRVTIFSSTFFFTALAAVADVATPPSDGGLDSQPGVNLTVQSLYGILQGLVCWASRFVLVAMVGFIIWYGVLFMVARGDPAKFTLAKKNLWYGVLGIIVILGAYTIVATVGNGIQSIGSDQSTTAWNNYIPLDCSTF